jgi:signal peptidase II
MAPSSDSTRRGYRTLAFWVAVALVTIVDQATKAAVKELLEVDGATHPFIPGIMELRLVHNTGAAFSIGEGAGVLFIILAIAVLAMMAVFVWRNPDLPLSLTIAMGCVAGGGVGNMIDRIIDGAVTDFFCTTFIDFAVFNVADIFVTCGLVVTFILFLRYDSKHQDGEE